MDDQTQPTMPNPKTFFREKTAARDNAVRKVMDVARAVLPVLKDHGAKHSAQELEAALFLVDAIDQEIAQYFAEDPQRFLMLLRGSEQRGA